MARIPPAGVFFALFTLSGFAGLIYQSIWSHYLKLFLGHAAYAQTLVLGIFMGGMALGAWLVARYTGRIRNLLMGYAIAEFGIGVLALAFHGVFMAATGWAYDSALPALGGTGVDLFKWSLASALILPASILLGTTFPLMSAGILRAYPDQGGRALSMLYFTNSFGAAAGVLASGFVLIERYGLPGTILTAGLLNIVLALVVWAIVRRMSKGARPAAVSWPTGSAANAFSRAILAVAFFTGVASFIYEVTWIRMLTMGLGASTQAFEVMIAAFILAMSLGAFWFRNRIARIADQTAWLTALLVAKALFAAYAVWIYPEVLAFMGWTMQAAARTDGGYAVFTIASLLASMAVMFPTAFCAGMTLPLATHMLTSRGQGEAAIGRVYAANTAGCIVGAAFATHVGMEALGVKGLTASGAALDVAVALLVLAVGMGAVRRKAFATAVAAAGIGAVALFATAPLDLVRMASGVYRHGVFEDPGLSRLLFYRDGKTATISIKEKGTTRSIRTNGKPDASVEMSPARRNTPDEITMTLGGALPLAFKPDAKTVAIVGLGSGLTTQALLGSPNVTRVETIEIERMVIDAARHFSPRNDRVYADPRHAFHIEDAKTFFAAHGRKYDLIVSEPSNPWVSGVSTLFSEEFYAHTRRYLEDGGLFVQWVQAYEIDVDLLATVFKAMGKHYGDYAVFTNGLDILVVATPAPKMPALRADVFGFPVAADIAHLGIRSLHDFEAMRLASRATLEPLWIQTGYPPNSDYFPILDQRSPRARFVQRDAKELIELRDAHVPALALLDRDTRTDLGTFRKPGVNRTIRADNAVGAAEALGLALGEGSADAAQVVRPEDRAAAIVADRLAGGCRDAGIEWMNALTRVARATTPFVSARDSAPLFEKARACACAKSLDEVGRRRLALLEAINALDARAMSENATWMLERLPPQLESERTFLVQAALAGAVASKEFATARVIARSELPRMPRVDREGPMVQLLLGHINAATRAAAR